MYMWPSTSYYQMKATGEYYTISLKKVAYFLSSSSQIEDHLMKLNLKNENDDSGK